MRSCYIALPQSDLFHWARCSEIAFMLSQMARFPSFYGWVIYTYSCCSVSQSCPTLCDPMDCSMPGLPVLTISQSLPEFMFIALVMPSSHLILWWPLLLLPLIFPGIRDFSNKSSVWIRWPKYWNFSFSISPSSEYSGLISLKIDWSKGLSEVFSSTTVRRHQFFGTLPSLLSSSDNHTWPLYTYIYMYILYIACHILERETEGEESNRHLLMWGVRFHPEGEGREDRTPQTPCRLSNSPTGWISLLSPECPRSNTLVDIFHLTNCVGYSEAQIHKYFLKEDFYKSYWEVEYF